MHSQQQGAFHYPHIQNTAAAGIIRPVPQHAQPQANRVRHWVLKLKVSLQFGNINLIL